MAKAETLNQPRQPTERNVVTIFLVIVLLVAGLPILLWTGDRRRARVLQAQRDAAAFTAMHGPPSV